MPTDKIKDFLNKHHVNYTEVPHPLTYSARETSHVTHLKEHVFAKTVIVQAGNKLIMTVVPSNEVIDFDLLKKNLKVSDVILASETDFTKTFPDCELGAMPPFGNLYNLEVVVEEHLTQNNEIAFNAGSHTEMLKIAYKDYDNLVKPKVMHFTQSV